MTVKGDAVNGKLRVLYPLPTATDNSGQAPSVVCTPTSGTDFVVGDTTVTCTATDAANNERVRSFVLTVVDNNAPSFTLAPGATFSVNVSGADAISAGSLALHSDPTPLGDFPVADDGTIKATAIVPTGFPLGSHTLTLLAPDENGNPILWEWAVTVVPPTVDTATPPTTAGTPA